MRKMKAGRISKEEYERRIRDFDPEDLWIILIFM